MEEGGLAEKGNERGRRVKVGGMVRGKVRRRREQM